MRSLIKTILAACVAMASGVSFAADVVIDNQNIPGSDIQSISISPNTGNIFITTIDGYTVQKDGGGGGGTTAPVVNSFGPTTTTITVGTTVSFSWSVSNATYCEPVGGTGGWVNKTITVPTGSTNVPFNYVGSYTFHIDCYNSTDSVRASVGVEVVEATELAISSFTATPTTMNAGESTTIAWVTQNAVSCSGSNGTGTWNGASLVVPSGSLPFTINTPGTYQFDITCSDGATGQVTGSVSVVVNETSVNNCGSTPLAGSTDLWEDFWLEAFPLPTYSGRYMTIARTGYKALRFNTGNVVDNGKLSTIETTQTDGVRLGAISECPGDFDVTPECSFTWGLSGGLRWATDGRSGACQLENNKTYYFNVTFTNGVDPTTTTCPESPCITKYQHENF